LKSTSSALETAPSESGQLGLAFEGAPTYERVGDEIRRTISRRDGITAISSQPCAHSTGRLGAAAEFELSWLKSKQSPLYGIQGEGVTVADLFCGCGGMTLGILEACRALNKSAKVQFACDLSPDYLEVYTKNFAPSTASDKPIESAFDSELGAKLSPTEKRWGARLKGLTLAVGGPPCQGHSDLNNYTRRNDPRNSLYLRMARFAEVVEPEHIIIENVLGVRHDKHGVFNRTAEYLGKLGYFVDEVVLKAEELGIPQRRHRAFIVASKSLKLNKGYFALQLQTQKVPQRPVSWAFEDLLGIQSDAEIDVTSELSKESKRRVDWLFDNDEHDLPDSFRPGCHKNKDHTYKSVYGRLFWDQPSWTITTGFLVMGQGRFIHPLERRVITPHEAARLQFFPDFFDFGVRPRGVYAKMIGNAVPSKMAFAVALELLR
jgi:DNA (cytosine-5)-methyltransferase 1